MKQSGFTGSALITGATSGIGRALAIELAGPGVTLHLGGRDAVRLAEAEAACRARGAAVVPRVVDVTDAADTEAWISGAGHLDLVIANAGIAAGMASGRTETPAQTRAVFATNLDGALNTVLPAIAAMRAQSPAAGGLRGRIAVVASIAAFFPSPGAAAYSASKAGIDTWIVGMARPMAREGIIMTSICPGFIRTPMTAGNAGRMPGIMAADVAARRMIRGIMAGRARVVFPLWLATIARTLDLMGPRVLARLLSIVGR